MLNTSISLSDSNLLPRHASGPLALSGAHTPPPATVEPGVELPGIVELWRILACHNGAIAIAAALGMVAGIGLSLIQRPTYRATAVLEIQYLSPDAVNMRGPGQTTPPPNYSHEAYVVTQAKILTSRRLMERVVDRLHLEKRAEFHEGPGKMDELMQLLHFPPRVPAPPREQAITQAMLWLSVRPMSNSQIIEVNCIWRDPTTAAAVAATLAEEFIAYNRETRWESAKQTGEWLNGHLDEYRRQLEKLEDGLELYSRDAGLFVIKDNDNAADEKLRQIQDELSKAQAERIDRQSRFEIAKSALPDSLPDVLDSALLRDHHAKIAELQRQLAELSMALTPEHYKVVRIKAQISAMVAAFDAERANVVRRIRNEYEASLRREALLADVYTSQIRVVVEQGAKSAHYNVLKREVETNRQMYDSMLQKVREAGVAATLASSNVNVVDPPVPPPRPYKPKKALNAAAGLLSGLLFGAVFALLRERTDRRLKMPGDLAFCFSIHELGAIPSAESGKRFWPLPRHSRPAELNLSPPNERGGDEQSVLASGAELLNSRLELFTLQARESVFAESFRATSVSMLFLHPEDPRRVVVLTSPTAREGKTTVLSNLGIAIAEMKRRVLLIDCDLRCPRLHEIFNLVNSWGLSDLLMSNVPIHGWPLDGLVRPTGIAGLSVLPSGPGTASISNLLNSPRLPELLQRYRAEFDVVLIDTPPVLQFSDARVLGKLAEGVIVVARANLTTREAVSAAVQRLSNDGSRLLGTILNDWRPRHGHANGYYDDHLSHYGH